MGFWLIPLSMLEKRYFVDSIAIVPMIAFAFFCMYEIFTRKEKINDITVNSNVVIFAVTAILAQTFIILFSYKRVMNAAGSPDILHGTLGWYIIVLAFLIDYFVVSFCIKDERQMKLFFKGMYICLIIFSVFVLIPQLISVTTSHGDRVVNFIAKLFEERHKDRNDFYWAGSYTVTIGRMNGFCPEASFLAAQLGIVFIPPIVAGIKNNYSMIFQKECHNNFLNWLMLSGLFLFLIFAKTSTGFLVIALTCLILFLSSNLRHKVAYIIAAFFLLIILAGMFYQFDSLRSILMDYVLKKQGTSNRLGGTIGLIYTFLQHPIFGVGNGYQSYYLLDLVPKSTTHNAEFLNTFVKHGYPAQSKLFGFFANYGLIITLPVIYYIIKKLRLSFFIASKVKKENNRFYATVLDSFHYFVVMYAILSLLSFTWNETYYVVMFMFYVVSLKIMKNKETELGE
ncbi:O-antigen ligase family protein [Paucilactobacillus sp. N302-9]